MSDAWLQVQVRIPSAIAEDVRLVMERREGVAVAVEDEVAAWPPDESRLTGNCLVTAWIANDEAGAAIEKGLVDDLWLAGGLGESALRSPERSVTNRGEWLAREAAYAKPVNAGRFQIVPPGQPTKERARHRISLTISAAGAFGTGLHPSTRGMLLALGQRPLAGRRVLDVGTGSGVLAIAAARLGAASVLAIESDLAALETARANADRNGLAGRIEFIGGKFDSSQFAGRPSFDLVMANITADVHRRLLSLYRRAGDGGQILLGGVYQPRLAELQGAMNRAAIPISSVSIDGDWVVIGSQLPGGDNHG